MTLQGLNNCLDNTKLWHIMNQLNKIYKKKNSSHTTTKIYIM